MSTEMIPKLTMLIPIGGNKWARDILSMDLQNSSGSTKTIVEKALGIVATLDEANHGTLIHVDTHVERAIPVKIDDTEESFYVLDQRFHHLNLIEII